MKFYIHEVYLQHKICNAWILDIRISTSLFSLNIFPKNPTLSFACQCFVYALSVKVLSSNFCYTLCNYYILFLTTQHSCVQVQWIPTNPDHDNLNGILIVILECFAVKSNCKNCLLESVTESILILYFTIYLNRAH